MRYFDMARVLSWTLLAWILGATVVLSGGCGQKNTIVTSEVQPTRLPLDPQVPLRIEVPRDGRTVKGVPVDGSGQLAAERIAAAFKGVAVSTTLYEPLPEGMQPDAFGPSGYVVRTDLHRWIEEPMLLAFRPDILEAMVIVHDGETGEELAWIRMHLEGRYRDDLLDHQPSDLLTQPIGEWVFELYGLPPESL